jgi:hypothetical protein
VKLLVYRQRDCFGRHMPRVGSGRVWVVYDTVECAVIARFLSHRAALSYALWKSALLPNYGTL